MVADALQPTAAARSAARTLVAFATALALWGVAPAARAAPDDGELRIGITQFPSTLNPNIDAMLAKTYVLAMAQRPITVYDHDWQLICMLCVELPTIENGLAVPEKTPDGKQGIALTYSLQPDATWGDGTPVSTDDVVFTWEVGKHPQSGVANFELYRSILSIDVKDAKTFTLHNDKLDFDFAAINDFRLLPAHLERQVFEQDPVEYRNRTLFDTDSTNPGLYFGPYRVVEVVSGSHIVLAPNDTWYGAPPHFSRLTVRTVENTAALEANLLSGAIDMISGDLGLAIDQALAFEKRNGARYNVEYKAGLVYEHIDMNLDNPILKDLRVRRALLHAIDRETLSRQLFEGKQPVAQTFVSPLDWIHGDEVPTYPFDPSRAAALLDEAGWSEMRGGVRHSADGAPLTLEFGTTSGNRSRELVQQVLQSQWRELGIDVRIKNQPARVFFGETLRKRAYGALAMYAWISSPENVPRTTLHSSMIPSAENAWAGQNNPGFVDTEADALIEEIELELDRDRRKALWLRLQQIYAEQLPVLPLYWRANSYITSKWLEGLRPTGHQGTTTLWVEEWRRKAQ